MGGPSCSVGGCVGLWLVCVRCGWHTCRRTVWQGMVWYCGCVCSYAFPLLSAEK